MPSRIYEITFSGQAGRTLRAQFDDCTVTTSPETTTLRADLPDQAALSGLVERIVGLGLEIIDVHRLTQPSLPFGSRPSVQEPRRRRHHLRRGDGRHYVPLDKAIKTMRETGADMKDKYKETARGGLALNIVEC